MAPHLCYNVLREPLAFVSEGEREESTDGISCPFPEKDAMPQNHSSRLLRSVSPHLQMKLRKPQQLTCPRSQRDGAEQGLKPKPVWPEDPQAFFHSARHLTVTAGHCQSPQPLCFHHLPALPGHHHSPCQLVATPHYPRSLFPTTAYQSLLPYNHVHSHWWILIIKIF